MNRALIALVALVSALLALATLTHDIWLPVGWGIGWFAACAFNRAWERTDWT